MSLINDTSSTHSSSGSSSRFSLILLEPGEIYFEDYLVYYHELKCPFTLTSLEQQNYQFSNTQQQTLINDEQSIKKLKGNIKICSKSIVFDPIDLNYPLIKFQYKSIDKIEQFDLNNEDSNDLIEDIYSTTPFNKKKISNKLIEKCFAISVKQIIKCKTNNKIGPYTTVKRENLNDKHYFQFIFTNVNDSLDLMRQLHRASTLEFEQEDIMLQLILKSRLSNMVKFDLKYLDDLSKEQIQFESVVYKINPLVANPGKIILSNMCLYYKPFNNLDSEKQILKIKLKNIKYVIKRRYHLRKVGCEIIFDDDQSKEEQMLMQQFTSENNSSKISSNSKQLPYLYLTFEDEAKRDLFYTRLTLDQKEKLTNLNNVSQENMLQKWRYGSISNYEYLMYLNNMADRSFNDLTQYPVYPWVLKDYTSQTIDLNNEDSYRDLSKPIGALSPDRLQRLKQRCKEMSATATTFSTNSTINETINEQPVFLYGSHYSTPAFVSFYLVREYPEWQLCLQNGRFDHPNRLFHSFADTWKNCLQIDSDVKELIPEFYDTSVSTTRLGSFLTNYQELDLGIRQDNLRVNNVILPKWSNNSPVQFIQTMRDALESDYVSENLHKWIDLIFGYKQRGDEAFKADNLFYYLCYEGAVNLDSIQNYSEKKSLEIQIQEFGQIPSILFNTPHLPRAKKIDLLMNSLALSSSTVTDTTTADESNPENNKIEVEKKLISNIQTIDSTNDPMYPVINAVTFEQIEVKFQIKLHKGQINDCLFIEQQQQQQQQNQNQSKNNFKLPLVCSVSSDNWMKIYSLDDRSLFRSHNVSNFSLSSVECLQINDKLMSSDWIDNNNKTELNLDESVDSSAENNRTILFLGCWDNTTYLYDLNYNRCFYNFNNLHDDAVSRVRLFNTKSINSMHVLTSSWDSLIKLNHLTLKNSKTTDFFLPNSESIKVKCLSELAHDSSVTDFCTSKKYLASICDDGNVYVWKLIELGDGFSFNFFYSIQMSSDMGKITDCKIIEINSENNDNNNSNINNINNNLNNLNTIAVCTSYGYLKIFSLENNSELFSIRLNLPDSTTTTKNNFSKLNKLHYSIDHIITIDSNGYVYFVNLQQKLADSTNSLIQSEKNSFLSHTIKLCSNSLQSLSIYKNSIICVGDIEGYLYFLAIFDI